MSGYPTCRDLAEWSEDNFRVADITRRTYPFRFSECPFEDSSMSNLFRGAHLLKYGATDRIDVAR
jgi:hypothetical protein